MSDKITVDYLIKVQKPKRPIVTEIKSIKVTKHPAYEHTSFIEGEFLKKMMSFEKPSQSEIMQ